jgi:hypothetical protein
MTAANIRIIKLRRMKQGKNKGKTIQKPIEKDTENMFKTLKK